MSSSPPPPPSLHPVYHAPTIPPSTSAINPTSSPPRPLNLSRPPPSSLHTTLSNLLFPASPSASQKYASDLPHKLGSRTLSLLPIPPTKRPTTFTRNKTTDKERLQRSKQGRSKTSPHRRQNDAAKGDFVPAQALRVLEGLLSRSVYDPRALDAPPEILVPGNVVRPPAGGGKGSEKSRWWW